MLNTFIIFLLVVLAVAAVVRGDFAFTIFYLIAGAFVFGAYWNKYAIRKIRLHRSFESKVFIGENIPVMLNISNEGYLPIIWLRIHESLPIRLATNKTIKQVISLNPRGHAELKYNLRARKRGIYAIGPLFASSNDILGFSSETEIEWKTDTITVYPKIIALSDVQLPSRSPIGTLRHHQPIFEDPSRIIGKRDYVVGDSLRRIDWKSTAAIGRLQVKQYEASIALDTVIALNLNHAEYPHEQRIDSTELGIVIAASLANWITSQKQSVGLITNGIDPHGSDPVIHSIPSRKGQGHLMRILETLARVQTSERTRFTPFLRQQIPHLPWGTTLALISGQVEDSLFDELFQAQRRGLNVVIILAGRGANALETKRRAESFGFTVYAFRKEEELDLWRK